MTKIRFSLLLLLTILCGGCGSFLASIDAEPIKDDPGERTYGAQIEDESIETKATVNMSASDAGFKSSHFSIISYNGYVLIAGQVPEEALKQKATAVVREIRGVRRIYNELEVSGNTSAMTRSSDTWLTTKVKTAMLADKDSEGRRIKVVTENSIVYLMGLLTRDEAESAVARAREVFGVRKIVKVFEYIN